MPRLRWRPARGRAPGCHRGCRRLRSRRGGHLSSTAAWRSAVTGLGALQRASPEQERTTIWIILHHQLGDETRPRPGMRRDSHHARTRRCHLSRRRMWQCPQPCSRSRNGRLRCKYQPDDRDMRYSHMETATGTRQRTLHRVGWQRPRDLRRLPERQRVGWQRPRDLRRLPERQRGGAHPESRRSRPGTRVAAVA